MSSGTPGMRHERTLRSRSRVREWPSSAMRSLPPTARSAMAVSGSCGTPVELHLTAGRQLRLPSRGDVSQVFPQARDSEGDVPVFCRFD